MLSNELEQRIIAIYIHTLGINEASNKRRLTDDERYTMRATIERLQRLLDADAKRPPWE